MCAYSAVMDNQKWIWNQPDHPLHVYVPPNTTYVTLTGVSQEEFNKLKAEVEELKILLIAAKQFDEKTGQPDCEADEKVALLKRVAEALGVDIQDAL